MIKETFFKVRITIFVYFEEDGYFLLDYNFVLDVSAQTSFDVHDYVMGKVQSASCMVLDPVLPTLFCPVVLEAGIIRIVQMKITCIGDQH